jgi:hypothetical protein
MAWPHLDRCADEGPAIAFDLVSKDVVPNTNEVPTPGDDTRPGEPAEEGAGRPSPSGSRDDPSDDSGERSQEALKCVAPPCAHDEMQVRADVGIVVNANAEATAQATE